MKTIFIILIGMMMLVGCGKPAPGQNTSALNKETQTESSKDKDYWNKEYSRSLSAKDYDAALNALDKLMALESVPKKVVFDLRLKAQVLEMAGRFDEEIKVADQLIELAPKSAYLWYYNKALAYDKINQPDEALNSLNKSLEISPTYINAWNHKVSELYTLGRYEEGLEATDKIMEIEPKNEKALIWREIILVKLGKSDEKKAFELVNGIMEKDPKNTQLLSPIGEAFYGSGKNAEALKVYNEILELEPGNFTAWLKKWDLLFRLDRSNELNESYKEAINAYDNIIKSNPKDVIALSHKGFILLHLLQSYNEAIAVFGDILKIRPNDIDSWTGKGEALKELDKLRESLECFNKAIELNPNYGPAWLQKGNVLQKMKMLDEAIQAYNRDLELNQNPKTSELQTKNDACLYNLAMCYSLKADKKNTLKYLGQIKSHSRKDAAKHSIDFKWLWDDEKFKKITGSSK